MIKTIKLEDMLQGRTEDPTIRNMTKLELIDLIQKVIWNDIGIVRNNQNPPPGSCCHLFNGGEKW